MSTPKGSFLFVALPPEGQEPSLVYQNLKSKVANAGNPFGEISGFPIPQFKVRVPILTQFHADDDYRLGPWIPWSC